MMKKTSRPKSNQHLMRVALQEHLKSEKKTHKKLEEKSGYDQVNSTTKKYISITEIIKNMREQIHISITEIMKNMEE